MSSTTLKEITFYVIRCRDPAITDCYVGQTENFNKRRWHHKRNCFNQKAREHSYLLYRFIREHGGWENWVVEELETRMCMPWLTRLVEREWYEELGATLNYAVPGQDRHETQRSCNKAYYQANRDKIKSKHREKVKCECGSMVTKYYLTKHRKSKKHARLMAEKSA